MRALKLLVVVLGVMLAAGTIALIAAVVVRVRSGSVAALEHVSPPTEVKLPVGAHVAATEMAGDRLLVRLTLPQGGEQLLVFNLSTGARIATIELLPAGTAGEAGQ